LKSSSPFSIFLLQYAHFFLDNSIFFLLFHQIFLGRDQFYQFLQHSINLFTKERDLEFLKVEITTKIIQRAIKTKKEFLLNPSKMK